MKKYIKETLKNEGFKKGEAISYEFIHHQLKMPCAGDDATQINKFWRRFKDFARQKEFRVGADWILTNPSGRSKA